MGFHVIKGDLLKQKYDAIVIPSQPSLKLEGIIGDQIAKICGSRLELELEQIKSPSLSESIITDAYNLPCKKLIHVANPKWNGGKFGEETYLKQSYLNCLKLAKDFQLKSIAFPLLSAGAYEFPHNKAIAIAVQTLSKYSEKHEDIDIALVIYKIETWNSYKKLFKEFALESGELSSSTKDFMEKMNREKRGFYKWYTQGAEEILDNGVEAQELAQRLLFAIKSKGLSKKDCYSGVISKTAFDKIVAGSIPSKYTLVALGINIGLDKYEIDELLAPIGERLNEFLEKDQIIIHGINEYSKESIFERIENINADLISVGCIPLKTHYKNGN